MASCHRSLVISCRMIMEAPLTRETSDPGVATPTFESRAGRGL